MKTAVKRETAMTILHAMSDLFPEEHKLTILVRDPENDTGDMMLTLDDLDDLQKMLERCRVRLENQKQ